MPMERRRERSFFSGMPAMLVSSSNSSPSVGVSSPLMRRTRVDLPAPE